MGSKTKIMVFRMREIVYTILFACLIMALIFILILMFRPASEKNNMENKSVIENDTEKYRPGIYTASLTLNDNAIDVEVAVDADHINNIRINNLGETVTTMYPLVEPALDDLAAQICSTQSLDSITCSEENRYTSQVLYYAIESALSKAEYP